MSLAFRWATADDAPLLAEHRANVWVEVGDWSRDDVGAQQPVWEAFIRRTVTEGTYVAAIAEEDGAVVASGAILVQIAIPRPGWDSEECGRVQSVYVVPGARKRGIARALMRELLDFARKRELIYLTLHPSDEARALYASLGFRPADEMGMRLASA
ncbi:MAG TPA: GNAT family N-acetyltransferase [Candidatus Elarobacter sp.]